MTGQRPPSAADPVLGFAIDRATTRPIAEQIGDTLRAAIVEERIAAGARLPSWRDLAAQLGVARGTVRAAYDRLTDEGLIHAAGPAGTRVAERAIAQPRPATDEDWSVPPPLGMEPAFSARPMPFQMGVPAQDAFPATLWARLHKQAAQARALAPTSYPDPRGDPALRAQIAAYLAIARGIACVPDQIFVTGGYRSGLAMILLAVGARGASAWVEDPGYPVSRQALDLAGLRPVAVPVDGDGIDVAAGIARAPDAVLAVVTPGQQAPLGHSLSPDRRRALLRWASDAGSWIVEDDFLGELKLVGRASPALAADDPDGRVIHAGSFSKTLSPTLGLGFLVVPRRLAERFGTVAALLSPAPDLSTQAALAQMMVEGHYLRHLRRMKRLYAARRDALAACIAGRHAGGATAAETMAGLAILLPLPDTADDVAIARAALAAGLAPCPISPWYIDAGRRRQGLLLGVTNLGDAQLAPAWTALAALLEAGAG